MYFNKLLDSKDYEISSYVKKYFLVNSIYPIKLHVGCDSQNISNHTNYATGRRVNIATIELIIRKNMMYLQFLIPK